MGYPQGYKGYKVYDLETKSMVISRNVVFHETIFPFHHLQQDQCADPFPEVVLPVLLPNSLPEAPPATIPQNEPTPASQLSADAVPEQGTSSVASQQPSALSNSSLRRSTRVTRAPARLQDYQCNQLTSTCAYPLHNYDTCSRLGSSYRAYISQISADPEPVFYHQAVGSLPW